jgi:hypothetical protein
VTGHPSLEELADAGEGLLSGERVAAVARHLAGCAECGRSVAALGEVSAALAAEPRPAMPSAVADRLNSVLLDEAARRAGTGTAGAPEPSPPNPRAARPRTTLGAFGYDRPKRAPRRWIAPALVAALAAGLVAFGGYVLSARAGLNEPPVVAAVNSSELGPDAAALERLTDLDPHRFSQAWQCARQVTEGRIVGLASSTVDGTPALLVYTHSGGRDQVTVVTGCGGAEPSAGPSAVLTR